MKPQPELGLFSLEDVRQFFYKNRRRIFRVFGAFFLLGLMYAFLSCPKFRVEASFLEGGSSGGIESSLKQMVFQSISSSSTEAKASSLMRSNCILKPFIQKEGLQIRVFQRNLLSKLYHRLYDNYTVIFKGSVKDIDDFVFKDVTSVSDGPSSFFIRFITDKDFLLLDEKKNKIGKGELHKPFVSPSLTFTLTYKPSAISLKKDYRMHVGPWEELALGFRKGITIKTDKNNPKLLRLTIDERDRFRATRILNSLMDVYKNYLVEENDKQAASQLEYLEKRQQQMQKICQQDVAEHIQFLENRIGQRGFASSDVEMQFYLKPYFEHLGRLHEIECIQAWIQNKSSPLYLSNFLGASFKNLSEKIHNLSQEKDLIDLSLSMQQMKQDQSFLKPTIQGSRVDWEKELKEVRQQITLIESAIEENSLEKLESTEVGAIPIWLRNLQEEKETKKYPEVQEEFSSYLTNLVRLLKTQEATLRKRVINPQSVPKEFLGINLQMSKHLFGSYTNQVDTLELNIKNYQIALEKLAEPDFEYSALSSIAKEKIAGDLLSSITHLTWQLRDTSMLTEKEKARVEKELKMKKMVLRSHIQELIRVDQLTLHHIHDKLTSLQQVMLDRINQEMAVLDTETSDLIEESENNLQAEKRLLEDKLEDLKSSMKETLVYQEKELDFQLRNKMRAQVIQSIAQLVESKTISNNLSQVQSKPLDYALAPSRPQGKSGFFLPLLIGLMGALVGFLFFFVQALFKGLPVSNHTLKLLQQKVLGALSSSVETSSLEDISDNDLETLRRAVSFLEDYPEDKQVIGLIHPQGTNYAFSLLSLLATRKDKLLLINCDLQNPYQKKEEKGWLNFLAKGKGEVPILQEKGFDYLPSGGSTRFAVEALTSPDFINLLEKLKQKYNWIFLYSRASLSQVESKLFLPLSTKTLVTLEEESIETLQPFVNWSYDEGKHRLVFIRTCG